MAPPECLRITLENGAHYSCQGKALTHHSRVKRRSEIVRICSIIMIFHLGKLSKAKFFILCDVILLVRLQEKFEIDHSWE